MRAILTTALLAVLLVPTSASAQGQYNCGTPEAMTKRLAAMDKAKQGGGLTGDGSLLVDLFVAPDGSWSFVFHSPNGDTCVLAEGRYWNFQHLLIPTNNGDPA